MYNFTSTKPVESQKFPGITFQIRSISEQVRTQLLVKLIDIMAEIRKFQQEIAMVDAPRTEEGLIDQKAASSTSITALQNITDQILLLRKVKVNPVYAELGFAGISGLTLDGRDNLTLEDIRNGAPEELYNEIVEAVRAEVEMTDEEKRNLRLPTTSGALVAAQNESMIAPFVEMPDSTLIEIVPSTSQS